MLLVAFTGCIGDQQPLYDDNYENTEDEIDYWEGLVSKEQLEILS